MEIIKRQKTKRLLDAVDRGEILGLIHALDKDNIGVNDFYVVPNAERSASDRSEYNTLLHRALWNNAEDLFLILLVKGANPRLKGQSGNTVIADLFDVQMPKENIMIFGKKLVDFGVTSKELLDEILASSRVGELHSEPFFKSLMDYASQKEQAKKIAHQAKMKVPAKRSERIKA